VRQGLTVFLRKALQGMQPEGRAPKPDNWHLTLRFLGEVDQAAYHCLLEELGKINLGAPFEIGFAGLGAFPRPSKATVLWVGVDRGHQPLCALAAAVQSATAAAGFAPEPRAFSPHLTISRMRSPVNVDPIVQKAGVFGMQMAVTQVVLYRSHLRPTGAQYQPLQRFDLLAR
jgi:RNA 2',3'-cyclic 3'-phosphodiesterase